MASLEKRGRKYRVIFRFRGIKYTRALGTQQERTAQAALCRLADNLHRLELGTLSVPEGADLVEFLLADGRIPPSLSSSPVISPRQNILAPSDLTLAGLFVAYFQQLPEGSLEQTTITSMKTHQKHLEKFFGKGFIVNGLSLSNLQSYVAERSKHAGRHGRKVTPVTIKKAIITLRTVWNWGRHHGLITKLYPSCGLRFPKGTEKPHFMTFAEVARRASKASPAEVADLWECAFLSLNEIAELLGDVKKRACQSFIYPLFVFAAHTGARRSELVRSVLTDLDFDANLITIHERKKSHDKRTTRQVPMSPLLRQTLKDWLAQHPGGNYTFTQHNPSNGIERPSPLTVHEASYHFRHTLAGTKWATVRGWHIFRHSFCSNCAAKGIDQRIINGWVGHQTEDMVRRYRHLLPDQQQTAIAAIFGTAMPAVSQK